MGPGHPHVGVHICNKQVQSAVVVEIERLAADRSPGSALKGCRRYISKGAVSIIMVKLAPAKHVGDQQIEVAVLIVIKDGHIPAPAFALQASLGRDVGKSPVAVVAIENVVLNGALDQGRHAVDAGVITRLLIEAVGCPLGGIGDKKVQITIVIIVEKHRRLGVTDVDLTEGFFGDIDKLAAALAVGDIVKKDIAASGTGNEQVLMAVVIVIGKHGPDTDPVAQACPCLLRHIHKGAVASVLVQSVLPKLIHKINIIFPVAVIIAHGHSTTVIIEIDLEALTLFVVQELHAEG